jgi:AAA+ superfamily predicted ATPase
LTFGVKNSTVKDMNDRKVDEISIKILKRTIVRIINESKEKIQINEFKENMNKKPSKAKENSNFEIRKKIQYINKYIKILK